MAVVLVATWLEREYTYIQELTVGNRQAERTLCRAMTSHFLQL